MVLENNSFYITIPLSIQLLNKYNFSTLHIIYDDDHNDHDDDDDELFLRYG